jgi:hypothetical protein
LRFILINYIFSPLIESRSSTENEFRACVNHFAFNKNAGISNVCRFLFFLLDNQSTCQKLSEVQPFGLDQCLLEHWTRTLVCTQQPNHQLNKLTLELSKHVPILNGVDSDAVSAFVTFCGRLRIEFDQLSSFEKSKALVERNRILMEMLNEAKSRLRDEKMPEDLLQHMYAICSLLVEQCAPLLYASGNSATVVPVLLETLFNPTFLQNLPAARQAQVHTALRKHLPSFLCGIEQLLGSRDPYLERKVRQLFSHFVPALNSKNARHPIVVSVKANFSHKKFTKNSFDLTTQFMHNLHLISLHLVSYLRFISFWQKQIRSLW